MPDKEGKFSLKSRVEKKRASSFYRRGATSFLEKGGGRERSSPPPMIDHRVQRIGLTTHEVKSFFQRNESGPKKLLKKKRNLKKSLKGGATMNLRLEKSQPKKNHLQKKISDLETPFGHSPVK